MNDKVSFIVCDAFAPPLNLSTEINALPLNPSRGQRMDIIGAETLDCSVLYDSVSLCFE